MASSSSNNNDSDILQCGFCDMWGTKVQIFYHMQKEHSQSFDDDIIDSDEIESNYENGNIVKTTNFNKRKSGRSVDEWDEPETKFLLSKYNDYMTSVGPRKTFRTVKSMFQRISEDLKNELDITRSPSQCQNRYKTIMRRKRDAINNNNSTGRSRMIVPYEAELSDIAAKDSIYYDSILPEILMDTKHTIINDKIPADSLLQERNDNGEKQSKKRRKEQDENSICTILKEAYAKKEGKDRRHKEKMELFMKFIEKQVGPLDKKENALTGKTAVIYRFRSGCTNIILDLSNT